MPPNDKRGRVHSSTITVAVMPLPAASEVRVDERDLRWSTYRGSGAGGQHRNKTDSAVRVVHTPTGVMATCEGERSQYHNKQAALEVLRARLVEQARSEADAARSARRRGQVGTGMRADKRRTVRCQGGTVRDHETGMETTLRAYTKGEVDRLHPAPAGGRRR